MKKWNDSQLTEAVKNSFSIRNVLHLLDLIPAGGNYKSIKAHIKRLDLNTNHFTGMGHLKNKTHDWNPKIPLKDILVLGSNYQSSRLRERLISEMIFNHECSKCNNTTWNNLPIPLELDHINGDNTDNRIHNIRLLCPNCHAQTENYRGKNKGKIKT